MHGHIPLGAAFTIPAAFNMLVKLFPDPRERARAIGIFGITGSIGNGQFVASSV
jgi:hypothetical protein